MRDIVLKRAHRQWMLHRGQRRSRELWRRLLRDCRELGACAVERGAVTNARDHSEIVSPFRSLGWRDAFIPKGRPQFSGCPRNVLEMRRHDADDSILIAIERDAMTNDRSITAEPSAPQAVANQRDPFAARSILRGVEVTPERRHNSEGVEIAGAYTLTSQTFGL